MIMRLILITLFLTGCSMPEKPEYGAPNEYVVIQIIIDNDLSWLGLDTALGKVNGYADCNHGICKLYLPDDGRSVEDCIWLHEFKDHAVYNLKHSENYIAC